MLEQVDVLVIDLQDAGARYYTYPAAVATIMESAAEARRPVIVLDRPNPIGGAVQGDVQDSVTGSAVARFPIAMRHGMTIGELARLARETLSLDADLHVIPLDGWRRSMDFAATGLPFVARAGRCGTGKCTLGTSLVVVRFLVDRTRTHHHS